MTENKFNLIPLLTIFFCGGCFAALLMYYTSIEKNLDGIYNDSIFLVAAYFGCMAAITQIIGYIIDRVFNLRSTKNEEKK